jgi:hypothetical protein
VTPPPIYRRRISKSSARRRKRGNFCAGHVPAAERKPSQRGAGRESETERAGARIVIDRFMLGRLSVSRKEGRERGSVMDDEHCMRWRAELLM